MHDGLRVHGHGAPINSMGKHLHPRAAHLVHKGTLRRWGVSKCLVDAGFPASSSAFCTPNDGSVCERRASGAAAGEPACRSFSWRLRSAAVASSRRCSFSRTSSFFSRTERRVSAAIPNSQPKLVQRVHAWVAHADAQRQQCGALCHNLHEHRAKEATDYCHWQQCSTDSRSSVSQRAKDSDVFLHSWLTLPPPEPLLLPSSWEKLYHSRQVRCGMRILLLSHGLPAHPRDLRQIFLDYPWDASAAGFPAVEVFQGLAATCLAPATQRACFWRMFVLACQLCVRELKCVRVRAKPLRAANELCVRTCVRECIGRIGMFKETSIPFVARRALSADADAHQMETRLRLSLARSLSLPRCACC